MDWRYATGHLGFSKLHTYIMCTVMSGCGLNYWWVWPLVTPGGDFVQLHFIGVTVVGRWPELRGDRSSEVRNILVL